jgi:hypothetical protein
VEVKVAFLYKIAFGEEESGNNREKPVEQSNCEGDWALVIEGKKSKKKNTAAIDIFSLLQGIGLNLSLAHDEGAEQWALATGRQFLKAWNKYQRKLFGRDGLWIVEYRITESGKRKSW